MKKLYDRIEIPKIDMKKSSENNLKVIEIFWNDLVDKLEEIEEKIKKEKKHEKV